MSAPSAARWRAGVLEPLDACEVRPVRLLAADSWLLRDGGAVALDAHRARFLGSLPAETDPGADADARSEAATFWDAAIAALPRAGVWFPRLELRAVELEAKAISGLRRDPSADARPGHRMIERDACTELVLRMRPAPSLHETVVLATHPGPDPRRAPQVKGPDLERLTAIRTAAQGRDAGDAVLLDASGAIVETATANLAWWRDDVLCVPEDGIPQLPGVTLGALRGLAAAAGIEIRPERTTPADLAGCEVWSLNALHGIRLVERWVDGPTLDAAPGRLAEWRARLEELRHPLPAVPAPVPA